MQFLTYRPDLPLLPPEILAQARKEWWEQQSQIAPSRTPAELLKARDLQAKSIRFHHELPDRARSAEFTLIPAGGMIQAWTRRYIDRSGTAGIISIRGGTYIAPHRDFDRQRGINYWVTLGGPRVETCRWRRAGQQEPVSRRELLKFFGTTPDYQQLELMESHCIAEQQWHELAVTELHSVEGLVADQERWGISVSLGLGSSASTRSAEVAANRAS